MVMQGEIGWAGDRRMGEEDERGGGNAVCPAADWSLCSTNIHISALPKIAQLAEFNAASKASFSISACTDKSVSSTVEIGDK